MNSRLNYQIAVLTFCFLPHVSEMPVWASAFGFVFLALALFTSFSGRQILKKPILHFLTLALPIATYAQFGTLLGPEPASTLLTMLVALKLHEIRSPRDEKVVMTLNVLVVMTWLLFSQSLFTTSYMILALLLVGVGFMSLQSPDRRVLSLLASTPRRIGLDVLVALPLFLVFFFFFPRFSTPLSNIFANQQTRVGFSDDLTPGAWADLVQSDEVAFRVLFTEPVRTSQLYWRGLVLHQTDGFSWTRGREANFVAETVPGSSETRTIDYEIILEPRYGRTLFHLEQPLHLEIKDRQVRNRVLNRETHYSLAMPNIARLSLQGRSRLTADGTQESFAPHDLQIPENISQEVRDLAARLKAAPLSRDPLAISDEVLDFFRESGFQYTTTTPEMPRIDDFLFRVKAGFCEHYAAAYSLLMRLNGIPARVVIGFQGGEYNNYGNYLVIRDRNAHAWSEIFVNGRGWIRVDPTTAVNAARIETGDYLNPLFAGLDRNSFFAQVLQSSLTYFEAVNTRYILFLLDYTSETQIAWLERLGLKNVSKKTIWAVFFFTLAPLLVLMLYLVRKRPKNLNPLSVSFKAIKARLESSGFKVSHHWGPQTILQKIDEHPDRAKLDLHKQKLNRYIELAYGPSSQEEQNQFLKEL
mgnify:CR=1 FL=1